jgi:hypothetical protein
VDADRITVVYWEHNRRLSRIDPFKDENGIVNCPVHEKSLGRVRFAQVLVDKLTRSQNRCGKRNGEFLSSLMGTPRLI